MQLQENTLFANRYNLEQLLGRGGFSEVWLAKDNWTHLQIAIKVYAPGQGMDANGLQEFCGELANVFDLNHTNLLKPTHVDTWNDMPYLIMAYCSQGSLTRHIGKMSEEQMWKLIHDVASGLAYLHDRDIVHQDIKPDNILVDEYGNFVITDFGISTRARSTLRKSVIGGTASGGTTAYMGPERFSKQPAPTKASDVWSFGAMCYELLEGNVPFGELGGGLQKGGAETPTINAQVSDALKFTIVKMLSKETWDRPIAKTLMEWANNPSAIQIDYDLLTDEDGNNDSYQQGKDIQVHSSAKETQTIGKSKPKVKVKVQTAESKDKDKDKEKDKGKSKKRSIWIIVGSIVLAIIIVSVSIGITVSIQREQAYLSYDHDVAVSQFDDRLSQASLDNIDMLDNALSSLNEIGRIEDEHRYRGFVVYWDKRQLFIEKANAIHDEAHRKYMRAPVGTQTESRNLQKREQVKAILEQLGSYESVAVDSIVSVVEYEAAIE